MAENPVLKEARKRGIISAGTPTTGSAGGAAAQSGGANPVVQQFNGTLAKERAANQQRIIETTKAQTPAVTQQQDGGFDLAKFMVGTLGKGANAVAKAGSSTLSFLEKSLLEPLFPGITESTPIQDLNRGVDRDTAYLDSKYSANTAKGGKAAKIAEDVGVGVIQAIPQAVAALGTAGSSLAAQGLSKAASASPSIVNTLKNGVSQMAKNPNYWTSFLTTVGNDYESAKADGVDDTRAGLYAVADSLLGAAVEVSGGIQKLPAELQGNRFTVRKWIDTMLDEGKEEVVQGVLSRGLENVVYDKGNAIASTSDEGAIFNPFTSAKEFGMGAAVGGILGGAQGAASNVLQNRAQTARNARTTAQEGNPTPVVQNAPQAPQMGVAERDVERLFGQSEAAPQTEAAPTAQSSMDPLLKLLMGGKRVDQTTLSGEQFDALADRSDMAMDAAGRVFRVEPEQHIDLRRSDEMGNRKINAFQFDHPEIHPYYKEAAAALLDELSVAQKGGQLIKRGDYHTGEEYFRTKRGASERISSLLDDYGLSYAQIEKACNAIINDQGQENIAAAKRVEFVLDEMLSSGYQSMSGFIPANQNYLAAKAGIAGSQAGVEYESMIPDDLDAVPGDDGLGAANAGFDPYSHLQNQTDRFHPEGAYAARPVDVPTTNFEGRNIPRSASNIMGAQAIGDSDVRFIEQQIADGRLAFDTIRDTDAVARAQQTIAQNGFGGAMEQYRQAANAGVATKNNTALGQQLLLQAMREGDVRNTAELLSLYTRNSTTAAQAMQAQSIMRKLSPEGQLLSIQRAVQDLNERYGLDETLSEQDVQDFLNAGSDAERQQVRDRIFDEVADRIPRTFRGRFDALRYLAMLGNPRTHIRNILGNTLFQVPVAVKNRVGAVIEAGANRATGGRVERTKSITGANPLGQLAREAWADFENVRDFLDQSSRYRDERGVDSIERRADPFSNNNPVGRTINRLSRGNSDLLEAEDTAAKRFIYAQSLAGYLKANGVSFIQDADPALLTRARNYAADEAARNTFTDRNMVSDAVARLGRASRSDNPTVRAAGYMVEGTLPFKRTPANIAVRSVEYSPTGAVLGAVETVRGARAGDVERVATGLDRVAAGVSGTALLAAGFLAAGAGYVTGGEDEDEKQQGFNDLTGHQSYALEMEDGSSVTLDWLAPEAIPFFMGVELYNAGIENGLTLEEVTDALKNLSSPMLEMSMLQGLNDTVNNAAYAVNRGDNVIASLVTSALTNYLTQIFPTVGGQVERTGETERMSTYIDKNSAVPSDVQYTIGKVSQKIPGWDYQQIPYIDAWGRTEETGSEAERIFNNFFNPAYVSQVDVDKVEQELQRVKDATGDSGVFPERAGRSITVNGEKKDLTAEEYQKYAKAVGQSSYQLVKDGVNLPAYGAMSDTGKAEYISRLYKYATQTAKSDVSDYEVESWVKNAKTAKQDIGVSTAEYIALYEKYGPNIMSGKSYEKTKRAVAAGLSVDEWAAMKDGLDANGNDSVSQAEAKAYLNSHGFDRSTKADLWAIINSSWKKNPYA